MFDNARGPAATPRGRRELGDFTARILPASPAATTRIEIRRSVASAADWDQFAGHCGASFRCAYRAARAWQFEVHWFQRLYRWDILLIDAVTERKIGQCAVGVGRHRSVFSDSLQLLPAFADRWPVAMSALLQKMGPARYVYGSEWSLEPSRETELARMSRVVVNEIKPTNVQAIDLRRWPTFGDYLRDVSTNIRRNVKKAEKSYASLQIVTATGLARLAYVRKSIALRRTLFERKGVRRSTVGMVLRSTARLVSLRRYSRSAYLLADGAPLASYVGVHFGSTYAYLEGASDPAGRGTAWYLLMAMIERAFADSNGHGRFVMGSDDGTQAGVEAWEGLRRSREQCCATAFPTSVVQFTYGATP
ncbi:MAG TPA: GNAT family N-acetyltransferase [Tepidisphaeraceae bacterium]|jgi:hypothetical protein